MELIQAIPPAAAVPLRNADGSGQNNVPERRLALHVSDDELARRRAAWTPPLPDYQRGFGLLHAQHITQADEGCDFDFLETADRPPTPEPTIY